MSLVKTNRPVDRFKGQLKSALARFILPKRNYVSDGLITAHLHSFMNDSQFIRAYHRGVKALKGKDPGIYWRIHLALWCAANAPSGDFVECGTNEGHVMSAVPAYEGMSFSNTCYLCDCWDLPQYDGTFERAKQNFAQWEHCTKLIKGYMPEAAEHVDTNRIAFLHLDMNDGAVEVATLQALRQKLLHGAIILLDDYAYAGFEDSHDAWNKAGLSILSLPTGQGLILWQC